MVIKSVFKLGKLDSVFVSLIWIPTPIFLQVYQFSYNTLIEKKMILTRFKPLLLSLNNIQDFNSLNNAWNVNDFSQCYRQECYSQHKYICLVLLVFSFLTNDKRNSQFEPFFCTDQIRFKVIKGIKKSISKHKEWKISHLVI